MTSFTEKKSHHKHFKSQTGFYWPCRQTLFGLIAQIPHERLLKQTTHSFPFVHKNQLEIVEIIGTRSL